MNRRILAIGLTFLIAASAAGAQELSSGRMRVRIDPRNGRFTVHYMADVARRQFVALLDDKEARTSFPTLYLDQRAIRLGEAPEFRVTVSTEQGAALISYRSSAAVVRQRIEFATSPGASAADGIADIGLQLDIFDAATPAEDIAAAQATTDEDGYGQGGHGQGGYGV